MTYKKMFELFMKALNSTEDQYMKSIWNQKLFSIREKENKDNREEQNVGNYFENRGK